MLNVLNIFDKCFEMFLFILAGFALCDLAQYLFKKRKILSIFDAPTNEAKLKNKKFARVRGIAKITDFQIYTLIFIILIFKSNFYLLNFQDTTIHRLEVILGSGLFGVILDTFILFIFGTTFGKWIFKIKLRNKENNKLNLSECLKRNMHLWYAGLGAGMPLLNACLLLSSYDRLITRGTTLWDENRYIVQQTHMDRKRLFFCSIIALFIFIMGVQAEMLWEYKLHLKSIFLPNRVLFLS